MSETKLSKNPPRQLKRTSLPPRIPFPNPSLSPPQGCSFSPSTLAAAIRQQRPSFTITYHPDAHRQSIADSWPRSLDDSLARRDWGWQPTYTLDKLVQGEGEREREREREVLVNLNTG